MLNKNITNKKGVSELIGYILLIAFGIIISVIIYMWMKSYVPHEPPSCSAEIALYIKKATFNFSESRLNITLRNNGKFNVAGYFIHAKNDSGQEIATIDLSNYLSPVSNGVIFGSSVAFSEGKTNSFEPGDEVNHSFIIPSSFGNITEISITPTIFTKEDNQKKFASCGNSKVEGIVGAPFVCTPTTCILLGYQCNPTGWSQSDNCGETLDCGTCTGGKICNSAGQCVTSSCVPNLNVCLGKTCGSWANGTCANANCGTCSGGNICNSTGQCQCTPAANPTFSALCAGRSCGYVANGTCASVSCGTCSGGNICNSTGQCTLCGNSIINTGETCDDGNSNSGDGCSSTCSIESNWVCNGQPSVCVNSCPAYCAYLEFEQGWCTNSAGNCRTNGGTPQPTGNRWCTGGSQADTCCCRGEIPFQP